MMRHVIVLIMLLLANCTPASAQTTEEQTIDNWLGKMTLEEKVRMCFGGEKTGWVVLPGVERLGIPLIDASDGPRGLVLAPVTVFPSGLGFAATWNTGLAEEAGRVIGEESRSMNRTLLFGPAFNINRDPLGARFFEYMSEDPVVSGRMAAAQIRGMQSEGVAACAKHFACNGRDWNRNDYYTWCDERTLREIYLRDFEIAVKEGKPWAVMTAANGVNGEYCSDSHWLLNDVLKNEWGFKGIVLTDFCHCKSTVKAALAGLDVDMPWGNWNDVPFGKKLMEAVENGEVPLETLDDKVRRNLWLRYQIGALPGQENQIGKGQRNTESHQRVALRMAEESLVLLKNDNDFLPLHAQDMHRVVVIGPNAAQRIDAIGLGGSSGATAPFEVTALQGITERLQGLAEVTCVPLYGEGEFTTSETVWVDGKVDVTYSDVNGGNNMQTTASDVDFSWVRDGYPEGFSAGSMQVEIHGKFKAPSTGRFIFRLTSDDPAELWVQDMGASTAKNADKGAPQQATGLIDLEKGKTYDIRIAYRQSAEGASASEDMNYWAHDNAQLKLEWSEQGDSESIRQSLATYQDAIQTADLVVFVGGIDHNLDCEGRDRKTMEYPSGQAELIRQVAQMNAKTVVALYHGSPLTLPWLGQVPAVIDLFYPGMYGGTALAEALFGDINPSGHLTFSWPAQYSDAPINLSTQDQDNVYCNERLNVGYRYYDSPRVSVKPLFPFGHGLSYTTFSYSNLQISDDGKTISADITNIGAHEGAEVVQLYLSQPDASVQRPWHELKSFAKVTLSPGEKQTVTFNLTDQDYSYFDDSSHKWVIDPAPFNVEIGASSQDIRLSETITLTSSQGPIPVTYLLICCRTENKGTRFLVNGSWEPAHDYKNIDTVRDILQKIKLAGINVVGVDFTNPSMWDVPVYDSNGNLVDDFSEDFKPMISNIVQVCQEKDMNFFMFLGDPNAWTMKYWNTIAKKVWEDYAQHPNYQHYGFGDDRPLMVMFLDGKSVWQNYNRTPENEKDYISKFHLGTCQINGPITPQTSDGWGYRNYSESSDGNVRFVCPNGGVPPTDWYRIDADTWRVRMDWGLQAHHYTVIGSYDDTCDGIFWGIADVSGSRSDFHKNPTTIGDPYIYYNIVREKLQGIASDGVLITRNNGEQTVYSTDEQDIMLEDSQFDTTNPIISVWVLQTMKDRSVTYRRKTEDKWESLALPFDFVVTDDLLHDLQLAVPVNVEADGKQLTLFYRLLHAGEQVNAYTPLIIRGPANEIVSSHFGNATLRPSSEAFPLTFATEGYQVAYSSNFEKQTLWPISAFTVSGDAVSIATRQRLITLYPYRFYFTVTDNQGKLLYPGKTVSDNTFAPLKIIDEGNGIVSIPDLRRKTEPLYNLQGQYMGDNPDVLPKGIYVTKGRKIIKR